MEEVYLAEGRAGRVFGAGLVFVSEGEVESWLESEGMAWSFTAVLLGRVSSLASDSGLGRSSALTSM